LVWDREMVLYPIYVPNGILCVLVVCGQFVLHRGVLQVFKVGVSLGHARIIVADYGCCVLC